MDELREASAWAPPTASELDAAQSAMAPTSLRSRVTMVKPPPPMPPAVCAAIAARYVSVNENAGNFPPPRSSIAELPPMEPPLLKAAQAAAQARNAFWPAGRGLSHESLFEAAGPLTATEMVHRLGALTGTALSPGRSNVDRWSLTSWEQQATLDALVHASLGSGFRLPSTRLPSCDDDEIAPPPQLPIADERRPPGADHAPLQLDELRVLQTELHKLDASMHRISGVTVSAESRRVTRSS